ncbi:MAG: GerAB/ArcD/ProY family transporter [Bacilli bacterium]|jgi:spore germination protein KB|nr:GerAB/ArcD/ProY family transporter [Bacilli bacterium]
MSKRKIYSLSYFLGRAFFLGFGYSVILSITNKDSWICFTIGTLLGLILVYGISKIKEKMQEENLKDYLKKNKFLKYLILTLFFLFNLFIMSQLLFILETFAASYFLIHSPTFFILIPIIYLIYRITNKSWSTIGRIGEIFMPISFIIVIASICMLFPYGTIDKFFPIMTQEISDMIRCTLFYAFYSSAPFLLLLNAPMKEPKLVRKYLLSTITILLIGILIISVLGPNLIQIYRYPEYMILKKIKIFEFLEKIENFISITWILDVFMTLAISGNNIRHTLPKKKNKLLFLTILTLLYFLVIYLGEIYYIELQVYFILPIILGIFEITIMFLLYCYHFITKNKTKNITNQN